MKHSKSPLFLILMQQMNKSILNYNLIKIFTVILFISFPHFFYAANKYAQGSIIWSSGPWYDAPVGGNSTSVPTAGDHVFTNGQSVTINTNVICDHLTFTNVNNQVSIGAGIILTVRGKIDCSEFGNADAFSNSDVSGILKLTGEALNTDEFHLVSNNAALGMRPKNIVIQMTNPDKTFLFGESSVNYVHGSGTFTVKSGSKLAIKTICQFGTLETNSVIVEPGAFVISELYVQGTSARNSRTNRVVINGRWNANYMLNAVNLQIGPNGHLRTIAANQTNSSTVFWDGWWGFKSLSNPPSITDGGIPTTVQLDAGSIIEYGKSGPQNIPGIIPGTSSSINYKNIIISGGSVKTIQSNLTAAGNLVVSSGCELTTASGVNANFAEMLIKIGTVSGSITNNSYVINVLANDFQMGYITAQAIGKQVKLVAEAFDGFKFVNWKIGNTIVSSDLTYSFIANSNATINATFEVVAGLNLVGHNKTYVMVENRIIKLTAQVLSVDIFDSLGRLILSRNNENSTIDLKNNGIYLLKLKTLEGYKLQKIVLK